MTEIIIIGALLVLLGYMVIRECNLRRDIAMLQSSLRHARQSRDKQTCRLAKIQEIIDAERYEL